MTSRDDDTLTVTEAQLMLEEAKLQFERAKAAAVVKKHRKASARQVDLEPVEPFRRKKVEER